MNTLRMYFAYQLHGLTKAIIVGLHNTVLPPALVATHKNMQRMMITFHMAINILKYLRF